MSEPDIAKSDTELSSNSSWSVIEETDNSRRSSVENLFENDSDNLNTARPTSDEGKESDDTFINIPDEDTKISLEVADDGERNPGLVCFDELKEKTAGDDVPGNHRSKGKRRKKRRSEPLSVLSIAASVLTITGLTLLCMLFPQSIDSEDLSAVETNYAEVVTLNPLNFEDFINKTSDTVDIVNKTNLFQTIIETADDENFTTEVCPASNQTSNETIIDIEIVEEPLNFMVPVEAEALNKYKIEPETEEVKERDLVSSFEKFQNQTMGLIRDLEKVLMNPNLQIFLCTLMQDICLIKLVKQLNKPEVAKEPSDPPKKLDDAKVKAEKPKVKKVKKITSTKRKVETKDAKKNKEELSSLAKPETGKFEDINSQEIFISPLKYSVKSNSFTTEEPKSIQTEKYPVKDDIKSDKENGKSECERRFEELDNKWETAGHDHRRNVQEIKANFKNEVKYIKEQEKELSQRKKRINLIREKYIDRLKLDRERYLFQLRKLRDEHHRVMRELCLKKNKERDLKDAAVGNYAVLLPDTYDFQQKLQLLRNREVPKPQVNQLPPQPPTSVPKLDPVKSGNFTTNYQSFPNISNHKTRVEDGKKLNFALTKREKYIEKVKKYYDRKDKYLKKKAALATKVNRTGVTNSSDKVTTFTDNPFDDMVSHMISTISESKLKFYKSFSNSSIETVKDNPSKPKINTSESVHNLKVGDEVPSDKPVAVDIQEFQTVTRKKHRKRDLYDVAFDENSKKIKHDDMMKWSVEKRAKSPQRPLLSKQDPQKSFKDKIIIKGHM